VSAGPKRGFVGVVLILVGCVALAATLTVVVVKGLHLPTHHDPPARTAPP
jgi:hypothetical protein